MFNINLKESVRGIQMNSTKIEMSAVMVVNEMILKNDVLDGHINSNDKEPSWDGFVYLYESDDLKAENIKYRIPVQVKGKNDEGLLKREFISYPVQYKHLRNYYRDGGVFYIVVVISNNMEKKAVFYNALTTVKLADILKGAEGKKPEQYKSITMRRLKNNDSKVFFGLLAQFGLDREKQGSGNGEIIKKAINASELHLIDSIEVTSLVAKSESEFFNDIATGEVSLYGHRADIDMWLPFEYSHQRDVVIKQIAEVKKPFGIDDTKYYDSYKVERTLSTSPNYIIHVSDNLSIDLEGQKFYFQVKGELDSVLKDISFMEAVENGSAMFLGEKKLGDYKEPKISEDLRKNMDGIKDWANALDILGIKCNKRYEEFTEHDWAASNNLIAIYRGELREKAETGGSVCMWEWDNKVIPLLIFSDKNRIPGFAGWFSSDEIELFVEKDKNYAVPKFIRFKRDIFERLYDVEESIWYKEIDRIDFSEDILVDILLGFVELIAAYDRIHNETYYNVGMYMMDKMLIIKPDDEYCLLNRMQLLKRKRELSEEELLQLESIEQKSDDPMVKCGANILLGNKRTVQKIFDGMSKEQQEVMTSYPIYNLL